LSMAAYGLDAPGTRRTISPGAAAPLPSPDVVPPGDTNT